MKKVHEETLLELSMVKQHLKKVMEEHGHTIQQLKKSEEKFRTIADYTYNWEYWLSSTGKILYNSPSSEGLTGFSAEEFIANPGLFLSIIHPEDQDEFKKHRECACYTSKEAKHIVFRILTKEGDLRWVAHSCQPVYNSEGEFLGRRASNRNITTQKLAEKQINLSEERLRLALDASSDGVWDRNLVSNEEYFGENWHQVLGYTKFDVKNNSLTWNDLLHPDDKPKTLTAIKQHLDGLTARYESELRMRNKAGEWQWFFFPGESRGEKRSRQSHPLYRNPYRYYEK